MPIANLPVLDKSLGNWRKHPPNDFTVLFPVRSGTAPSVYHLLVGLHGQKYSLFEGFGAAIGFGGKSLLR
jgi:hypothetical protein